MLTRLFALIFLLLPLAAQAAPWDIVQDGTRIEVDATYLGGRVTMRFDRVLGAIDFDQNRVSRTKARIAVPTAQVETGLGLANNIIRSRDFLNVRQYPQIDFTLDRLVRTSDSTADVFGSMTLLGVTRPVGFRATVFRFGPARGDPSKFEAGFDLTGAIDRREFGHTAAQPELSTTFPVRIRLLLRSR